MSDAIEKLAKSKTGALIVFSGKEPLDSHFSGGLTANAEFSLPLILSIFDSSSPGHEGAVLAENGKIGRFGLQLPVSLRY